MSTENIVVIVLIVIAVVSFIIYKVRGRQIAGDTSEYDKETLERAEKYRESLAEEAELNDILMQNQYIYNEDDSEIYNEDR